MIPEKTCAENTCPLNLNWIERLRFIPKEWMDDIEYILFFYIPGLYYSHRSNHPEGCLMATGFNNGMAENARQQALRHSGRALSKETIFPSM